MSEDINAEIIKNTQKLLGKYIKKPALTEKLLRKPPFRFLHDVIKAVIKETGFLKGLFSEHELNSENIKDKDSKIIYLNKLIEAVKNLSGANFNVKAGKIVAGLEVENTNFLLQAIGKAIESKVESSEYVKKINSQNDVKSHNSKNGIKKTADAKKTNKTTKNKQVIHQSKTKNTTSETPKSIRSTAKASPKEASKTTSDKDPNEKEKIIKQTENNKIDTKIPLSPVLNNTVDDEKKESLESYKELQSNQNNDPQNEKEVRSEILATNTNIVSNNENEEESKDISSQKEDNNNVQDDNKKEEDKNLKKDSNVHKNSAVRPKSARPKSGERIKNESDDIKPLEMKVTSTLQRPKSSLRPPSVRPSSARPGAPRLRPDSALPSKEPVLMGNINVIVENIDNVDEEETVIIESNPEVIEDAVDVDISLKNKGHLVEQILEQIKEGEKNNQSVEVDWETNVSQNREGTSKELANLKTLIQNLTKAANPLGKLMNYLHEDLDAMYSELQMWTNTKKQLYAEIQKQKRLNVESNKPLLTRLEKLDQDIKKQQQEIMNVQSNILRNEMRIRELIQK